METSQTQDSCDAVIIKNIMNKEIGKLKGIYHVECRDAQGNVKWNDVVNNLVTTQGKNLALDTVLAGGAYTTVGPFMGLISAVGYSAIIVGDTAASHAGWTEAGATNAPTYTGPRKTCVFGAAAAGIKALTTALSFAITGTGTVKGCFIVLGTGAVNTIDSTAGVIYSAGLLAGGDKVVANTDVLNISYSASFT
jgi:hypothetical protein